MEEDALMKFIRLDMGSTIKLPDRLYLRWNRKAVVLQIESSYLTLRKDICACCLQMYRIKKNICYVFKNNLYC